MITMPRIFPYGIFHFVHFVFCFQIPPSDIIGRGDTSTNCFTFVTAFYCLSSSHKVCADRVLLSSLVIRVCTVRNKASSITESVVYVDHLKLVHVTYLKGSQEKETTRKKKTCKPTTKENKKIAFIAFIIYSVEEGLSIL